VGAHFSKVTLNVDEEEEEEEEDEEEEEEVDLELGDQTECGNSNIVLWLGCLWLISYDFVLCDYL